MMSALRQALLVTLALAGCQKPIELAWSFQSGSGSRSSPAITKDMVLFGNEAGYMNAVDRNDGSSRWRFPTTKEVVGSPIVVGDHVYFGSTNYSFYALDLGTGRSAWEFPTHDRLKGSPAFADGVVYFGSYDGHLYAVRAQDHQLVWQYPRLAEAAPAPAAADKAAVEPPVAPPPLPAPKAFSYARPLVADGAIYAGNLDGYLYAFDAKTGVLRWRLKTQDGITSSPVLEAGVLYFGSNDHRVYAVTGLGGSEPSVKWTFSTGDQVNAEPLLDKGVLYIGSSDHVFYALDPASGKKLWSVQLEGPVFGRAAIYQNLVFVGAGAGDGRLYAYDTKTNQLFWKYETGTKIQSDPVIEGDHLYVVAGDGQLLTFQIHKTTPG
jgi:eukaryotic-like serine/threonine-protein kinase